MLGLSTVRSLLRRASVILERDATLADLTEQLADMHGGRVAFILPEPSVVADADEITFTGVQRAVSRLCQAVRAAGVHERYLVAVIPSNGCDFFLALLAVARAGAIMVPINPRLKAPEIRHLIKRSGATSVVFDAGTREGAFAPSELPSVQRWLSLGPTDGATDVARAARRLRHVDPPAHVAPDAVVAVLHTSGTTGQPKAARLTAKGILSASSLAALNPTGLPGWLRTGVSALPVAHIMGFETALCFMMAGITHVMFPRFDPHAALDAIEHTRADVFVGVPTMYRSLLHAGAAERDLRSVKLWASAADVMPADLIRRFRSFGRLIGPVPALFAEVYGMVELSGAAIARVIPPALTTDVPWMTLPRSRIRVVNDDGEDVAWGRSGELAVKGTGLLEGYHNEEAGSELDDGWIRTGDLARGGPFGLAVLGGRKKNVLKVGGYSLSPTEVEDEIRRHPGVHDVAVVGVPDASLGQVPVAAVVPERGARLSPAELEEWARAQMAGYRRPRRWLIVDTLPMGSTRKIDRVALAGLFEQP
ncbi:MAG: class I adenylate-forming enzyme family protein [Actinomycetota bacterium]